MMAAASDGQAPHDGIIHPGNSMDSTEAPLLEMRGITKTFGGVNANTDVDLTLHRGDILGLLGENGAGKTTLMNVLFGTYSADAGEIFVDDRKATIRNSADALALGIGMVHQHFRLAPRLSILDNLMIGQPGRHGRLDRKGALERLKEIERHFGSNFRPHQPVGDLSVGEQQRLEIIKALFRGARILILDEPTAVLTPDETEGLFQALRAMAKEGIGIILITHKLNEIQAAANRVLVLRAGSVAGAVEDMATTSPSQLARMMCGRDIEAPERPPSTPGETLLSIEGLETGGHAGMPLRGVSMEVRAGEILGVAGVSGNGQRALADVLAGVLSLRAGRVSIVGRPVERQDPLAVQAMGLGRIPEDRMTTGLVTALPLADSMVLPRISQPPFSRFGVLDTSAIDAFASEQIAHFDIRCQGPRVRTGALSGGNLQKALLARELAFDPKVLLAAQPTRGLDIGAAHFVHEQFLAMRAKGCAILMISEDLEELTAIADRIAVMYEGRVVGVLPVAEASAHRLSLLMSGSEMAA